MTKLDHHLYNCSLLHVVSQKKLFTAVYCTRNGETAMKSLILFPIMKKKKTT